MSTLAQQYDCLLLDLDGTVFRGQQATSGAVDTLAALDPEYADEVDAVIAAINTMLADMEDPAVAWKRLNKFKQSWNHNNMSEDERTRWVALLENLKIVASSSTVQVYR